MKNYFILCICFLLLNCKYFQGDHCNNTKPIVGTYENSYDKNAKNILIIKENKTFEQIFIKGKNIKKNKGTWKFVNERCVVYLNNLKLLHKVPKQYEEFFSDRGIFRLNKIMFNEDLRKQFDFYRIKN